MDNEQFRKYAHELVDWMADYMSDVDQYPVKSQVEPGEIINQLPDQAPNDAEPFENIFQDFQKIIMPGITHWQHPSFFGYFPANSSPPSLLAEMLMSTLGAQCMIWQTSPAAAELEEQVMEWLKKMLGLPSDWSGVIQDTASTATLCALISARERLTDFQINKKGYGNDKTFIVYCSEQTHSSVEKDVKIAGFGSENLRYIEVDDDFALKPAKLQQAIEQDIQDGKIPLCVVATIGTTGSTAIDPLKPIAEICQKHNIWLHVDAAFAGTALLLEEYRYMIEGINDADSFVFNPHKWMFTNFDCSAYFVKDESTLVRTFEILPEYLKTSEGDRVKNYRDWGIPLGRRFRALKLWFVIRTYGVNGLKEKIKNHIELAQSLADKIKQHDSFELLAPTPFSLVCFRYKPVGVVNEIDLEKSNKTLLEKLNASGKMFLTHTKLNGKYTLRMQTSQTDVTQKHVDDAWELIQQTSLSL